MSENTDARRMPKDRLTNVSPGLHRRLKRRLVSISHRDVARSTMTRSGPRRLNATSVGSDRGSTEAIFEFS